MSIARSTCWFAPLALFASLAAGSAAPAAIAALPWVGDFAKASPFTAMRWDGDVPEVQVPPPNAGEPPLADHWWRVQSIDGQANEDILAFARMTWPSKWQKRYAEDLVEVMAGMGYEPGRHVALRLRSLDGGQVLDISHAEMREDYRRAIWRSRQEPERPDPPVPQVKRLHSGKVRAQDSRLVRQQTPWSLDERLRVSRATAEKTLDQLEWLVENVFSYRDMRGVDYVAALDSLRAGFDDDIGLPSFGLQLVRFVALFGDGHSRFSGAPELFVRPGYLPCLVGEVGTPAPARSAARDADRGAAGGAASEVAHAATRSEAPRFVAFRPDRSDFVDPARPYLLAIDGVPLERWLEAAADTVTHGSDALRTRKAMRNLRILDHLRSELELDQKPSVELELCAADGTRRTTVELPVSADRPIYGEWPRTRHELLPGNVGYLRVPSMDSEPSVLAALDDAMTEFAETRGLIIDVRGNGGGSRTILHRLFPYFLAPDAEPVVANVAAYRLPPDIPAGAPNGYLDNRMLFPATASRWTDAERAAIERAATAFTPAWTPGDGFSAWHYLVLGRDDNPAAFHYERPVIVLLDRGCYSATDIFLGAFELLPQVTLMGRPSGGGSGRSRSYALDGLQLEVRLSSMASFRPDGSPYDGVGIAPDVLAEPTADWFVGRDDPVLDLALERLGAR